MQQRNTYETTPLGLSQHVRLNETEEQNILQETLPRARCVTSFMVTIIQELEFYTTNEVPVVWCLLTEAKTAFASLTESL